MICERYFWLSLLSGVPSFDVEGLGELFQGLCDGIDTASWSTWKGRPLSSQNMDLNLLHLGMACDTTFVKDNGAVITNTSCISLS